MLSTIAKPFGMLLMWLYNAVQNYGFAVILFALIVKVILLPFMAKSKKSTMRASRLTPKLEEIKKRHGANQQKYNEELQKLYREEKINPMSGCLWSLLPLPILIALYEAIRFPLTIMMGVSKELIEEGGALHTLLYDTLGFTTEMNAAYSQIAEAQFISQTWDQNKDAFLAISNKITNIDFSFFGMDLGARPNWKFLFETGTGSSEEWLAGFGLFCIPIIAAIVQYFASSVSMKMSSQPNNEQAQAQMSSMRITMPLMTLWFGFMMPAALGLYWIANSAFTMLQDVILTSIFKKEMEAEDAERRVIEEQREAELEAKRQETARLRAENGTEENKNTSKKKKHRKEKLQQDEKAAEWEKTQDEKSTHRKHRHHKRKKRVSDEENPSRVGNRPYARGRAYDPNRFGPAQDVETEEKTSTGFESAEDIVAAAIPETVSEEIEETVIGDEYEDVEEEEVDETEESDDDDADDDSEEE